MLINLPEKVSARQFIEMYNNFVFFLAKETVFDDGKTFVDVKPTAYYLSTVKIDEVKSPNYGELNEAVKLQSQMIEQYYQGLVDALETRSMLTNSSKKGSGRV